MKKARDKAWKKLLKGNNKYNKVVEMCDKLGAQQEEQRIPGYKTGTLGMLPYFLNKDEDATDI